ncbi:hypothetical protein F4804DRAFT_314671 [Jackrogersella minutella]|nr:hypothetical protein F4804DRAFT_314671 [Jackrogersella minutella]
MRACLMKTSQFVLPAALVIETLPPCLYQIILFLNKINCDLWNIMTGESIPLWVWNWRISHVVLAHQDTFLA